MNEIRKLAKGLKLQNPLLERVLSFRGLNGAPIEPLTPLLLLLNNQKIIQNTEEEAIKTKTKIMPNKNMQSPPVKKRKSGGPKI